MKNTIKNILFSGLAASALLFTACQKEEASTETVSSEATATTDGYPLEVCVVSGEKLGSMGKPYVINYEGTEVQFCCDNCEPKFRENPAPYLAKIEAAE